jgi:hypothetical protein
MLVCGTTNEIFNAHRHCFACHLVRQGLWPFRVFIFARGEDSMGKAGNPAFVDKVKPSDGYGR